jgi:DNA transformation protein
MANMPFTPGYRAEVERKLALVAPVESKVMFGGVALYSQGLLFALIDDDKLYFKIADSNRPDFEAAGMPQFVPSPGARPMAYFELPPGLVDDPDRLRPWVDKAIAAAEATKKPKKKPKA